MEDYRRATVDDYFQLPLEDPLWGDTVRQNNGLWRWVGEGLLLPHEQGTIYFDEVEDGEWEVRGALELPSDQVLF